MRFALGPSLRLLTHHKHPTPPHQVGQVLLDWLQQREFAPAKIRSTRTNCYPVELQNTASTPKSNYQKARVGETGLLMAAKILRLIRYQGWLQGEKNRQEKKLISEQSGVQTKIGGSVERPCKDQEEASKVLLQTISLTGMDRIVWIRFNKCL